MYIQPVYIPIYYFPSISAVGLTGNRSVYEAGSTASVTCFTNLSVVSMRWLIQSSKVSFSINQTRHNELHLKVFSGISLETNGTKFTCEVINQLPIGPTERSTVVFIIHSQEYGNYLALYKSVWLY